MVSRIEGTDREHVCYFSGPDYRCIVCGRYYSVNWDRWEEGEQRYRELQKIKVSNVCAVCGGLLVDPYDPVLKQVVLRCGTDKSHKGYVKADPSLSRYFYERAHLVSGGQSTEAIDSEIQEYLNKKHSRKGRNMTTDSTALQEYKASGQITERQAMDIIRTTPGWGRAPDNVIKKAAMICRDYKLYPGIHVFLLKFSMRDGSESWTPCFGIKTNRLLASRKKVYKYVDGPRPVSPEEAQKHFLDEYNPDLIYAYCKVAGVDGSMADGWGTWPRKDEPYGKDKGNSKANMAEIRAERRALDRLCPGELPSGFEVIDEQYAAPELGPVPAAIPERIVDQSTGEIKDSPAASDPVPPPSAPFGVCPTHHVQLVNGKYGVYCPRKEKQPDGSYKFCKGGLEKATKAAQQTTLMEGGSEHGSS